MSSFPIQNITKFIDKHHNHVVTGDLNIFMLIKYWEILPSYTQSNLVQLQMDLKHILEKQAKFSLKYITCDTINNLKSTAILKNIYSLDFEDIFSSINIDDLINILLMR
ncbi:UNVERIFIED_CONTAM: hypothetical protein NCL1_32322 [Trichonephila clavipes]